MKDRAQETLCPGQRSPGGCACPADPSGNNTDTEIFLFFFQTQATRGDTDYQVNVEQSTWYFMPCLMLLWSHFSSAFCENEFPSRPTDTQPLTEDTTVCAHTHRTSEWTLNKDFFARDSFTSRHPWGSTNLRC